MTRGWRRTSCHRSEADCGDYGRGSPDGGAGLCTEDSTSKKAAANIHGMAGLWLHRRTNTGTAAHEIGHVGFSLVVFDRFVEAVSGFTSASAIRLAAAATGGAAA